MLQGNRRTNLKFVRQVGTPTRGLSLMVCRGNAQTEDVTIQTGWPKFGSTRYHNGRGVSVSTRKFKRDVEQLVFPNVLLHLQFFLQHYGSRTVPSK